MSTADPYSDRVAVTIAPSTRSWPAGNKHGKTDTGFQRDNRFRQSNNAAVWNALTYSELTEVIVKRYEHAILSISVLKDRSITRICGPIADPFDIVTRSSEGQPRRPPH